MASLQRLTTVNAITRSAWRKHPQQATVLRFLSTRTTSPQHDEVLSTKDLDTPEEGPEDDLEGKLSGENLRRAFMERSAAAIRYEYFAQRADIEAELEAASAFRSLQEVCKQQAMGFLELLEEYGTPVNETGSIQIGTTLDNIATAAMVEREDGEVYLEKSKQASEDGVPQLADWFSDMSDATTRSADRLELVSSMMDSEYEEVEGEEDGIDTDLHTTGQSK